MIRPARVEDAEALAGVQTRAWRAAYGAYVDAARLDAATAGREEHWRDLLAGEHGTFVIVGAEAALVGFVSVGASRDEDARPGDGELYAIYVEPDLLGAGIGTELLLYGEAELARTYSGATLWTFEQNTGARRFYERHGWRLDRHDPDHYDWAPSVRYRKDLTPAEAPRPPAPRGAGDPRTRAPARAPGVVIAVTDHAAERYRQRVAGRLDPRTEIASRVSEAWSAGHREPGDRGTVLVRDLHARDLVFVCRHDAPRGELIVVTLWEEGDEAQVPKRFTDALRRDDEHGR